MNDYSELKLLTQCVGGLLILQTQHSYLLDHEEQCAVRQFTREANPVTVLRLIEEIEKLKAENEVLRKDSDRYRWLAKQGGRTWKNPIGSSPALATGVLYDIAVDHVMGEESA